MRNVIKIKRSNLVDKIIIEDHTITIVYCDGSNIIIPKKDITSIHLEILASRIGLTMVEINTSDDRIINFSAQYNLIYDFLDNKTYLPDFSYKVITGSENSAFEKQEEYRKNIMEQNIEAYIKNGKKITTSEYIKILVPNKILTIIVIAFIIYLFLMFLFSL